MLGAYSFSRENIVMRIIFAAILLFTGAFAGSASAASLEARIDISEQTMRVYQHGFLRHTWKVSTARRGYSTPVGSWKPYRMHEMWHSRKYNMSPMPHSIFFKGGYAVHGTNYINNLGRPASHGCIRLHPDHARQLFRLVKRYGPSATRIRITR